MIHGSRFASNFNIIFPSIISAGTRNYRLDSALLTFGHKLVRFGFTRKPSEPMRGFLLAYYSIALAEKIIITEVHVKKYT